ncbi:isochorismatase family protein [Metasolibacillus meyeri]|uniref:Isochorismatase family protein n=1 Tax=Metasolibacillus meyeri TaxID=1071052 RepID=A0AAW9NU72_9BACL|nr:isochorismatase family protein [Metasolibacillus meyeri]MEC1179937.1 isochorismatase family protein [Metasolibacillus meyeri]
MQALLVIDVQNGLVDLAQCNDTLANIEQLIQRFQTQQKPVIFIQHFDDIQESVLHPANKGAQIIERYQPYIEHLVIKRTPSAFYQTNLQELLASLSVDHVYITGFNTEFCCQFTAIAAYDRGFRTTFIEDATNTVNNADTYEMSGLDIRDFVGTVLHWASVIEVVDVEEYLEMQS